MAITDVRDKLGLSDVHLLIMSGADCEPSIHFTIHSECKYTLDNYF